jgi:hypothetical protein
MKIVTQICPACGAKFGREAGVQSVVCAYCGTELSLVGPALHPPASSPAPQAVRVMPPPAYAAPAYGAPARGLHLGRGCLAAIIAQFVLPFLCAFVFVPLIAATDGLAVDVRDPLQGGMALIFGVLLLGGVAYAFFFFLKRENRFQDSLFFPGRWFRRTSQSQEK